MRIRQSTLGTADDCLRKMQYNIEHPPEQYHSGSLRAVGTAYHAARELQYSWRLDAPAPDDRIDATTTEAVAAFDLEVARAGEHFIWDEKVPDRDHARAILIDLERTYMNNGIEWPDEYKVLGVELTFDQKWGEHVRHGTMDLVLMDPTGYIIGVDHKTAGRMWPAGKEHPRKNNQAAWYVAALQELFPDAVGYRFCFDIITYAGKFDRRMVDPNPAHIEAVEAKALQVAHLYRTARAVGIDLPANPSSNLCSPKYCDFWTICPHGANLI